MQDLSKTRRLAVLYPKAIGDLYFALPALHTLRRACPGLHITLVVKQKQAPLALPQKGFLADEVLVLGGDNGCFDVRRQLAALKVDTLLDLAGNDQAGLLMIGRRGRRLRPHRADCKGMCALYSPFAESLPRLVPGQHRVEELLSFVRALVETEPVYTFRLELPSEAVEESERLIAQHDLRSGVVVAVNLGASRDTKRWPAGHVMTLVKSLVASGLRVALTGAPGFAADGYYDRDTIERFKAEGLIDGERCIDLVTDDGLTATLHLQRDTHFLRYSGVPAVVVGCDTGPMHMAGSVGEDARNRTISLFGPTNWGRYAPFDPSRRFPDKPEGRWNRVLTIHADCGPAGTSEACDCYRRGCAHKKCMATLSPETVFDCITSILETS
jgi:ADP-heptose:LPS heptosyltransferase